MLLVCLFFPPLLNEFTSFGPEDYISEYWKYLWNWSQNHCNLLKITETNWERSEKAIGGKCLISFGEAHGFWKLHIYDWYKFQANCRSLTLDPSQSGFKLKYPFSHLSLGLLCILLSSYTRLFILSKLFPTPFLGSNSSSHYAFPSIKCRL